MARKEEIIYAALELASVHGLKGVSMSQIAKKVGIKAPSLYNHFQSKDEMIQEMYKFLRMQAQQVGRQTPTDYTARFCDKSLEDILMEGVLTYIGMVSDKNMLQFFKVLYSERSTNPVAAKIVVEETGHMLAQTRDFFYALAVHGKIKTRDADMAAMTYALTLHSLVDYRMDMITAGIVDGFGDGEKPLPAKMVDFVKWFSAQIGGINEE